MTHLALGAGLPVGELDRVGGNAPKIYLDLHEHVPALPLGAVELNISIGRGLYLQALVLNQGPGLLIPHFHGAINRRRYQLPRFERLATLIEYGRSAIIFSDPTLHLADHMWLSWYTGWAEVDLHALMGRVTAQVAERLECPDIFLVGMSGGGFAALQTAVHVPSPKVLVINPSIVIERYAATPNDVSSQRTFIKNVMPHLAKGKNVSEIQWGDRWATPMGARLNAAVRYQLPQDVRVRYVNNLNDYLHVIDHFGPFKEAIEGWASPEQWQVSYYDGPTGHIAPTKEMLLEEMETTLAW